MIVKILSAARNFEGVDYNERKNDQGKSELLQASNFQGLANASDELKKSDYIAYMKMVGSLNKRVTNKQFHAVISTKGREHTHEELKQIAVAYLDKMGYGNNPYLIYAHSDTENNHVHLVSTRVDKEGKKINDKFEKIRSQAAIQEILKNDPKHETAKAVENALSYNFSTHAQFKLLLELQGFKVTEEGDAFKLIKYGKVQDSLDKKTVEDKIEKFVSPDERIKQLKAIFYKYRPGLNLSEFIKFSKEKFGIDVVLHQAKGKDRPYGCSLVDNSSKAVIKGSQVMPLKEMLSIIPKAERLRKANEILALMLQGNPTFSELRKEMQKLGFEIDNQGAIKLKGEDGISIQLEKGLLQELKYNERVGEASKYTTNGTYEEKEVLAKLFFVRPDDLELVQGGERIFEKYHDLMQNIVDPNKADEVLESLNIKPVSYSGNYFLINAAEKEVSIIDPEHIQNLHLDSLDSLNLNKITQDNEVSYRSFGAKDIFNILFEIVTNAEYKAPNEKEKKRKKLTK